MIKTSLPLQNSFLSCLEKSSSLTKREHQALWALLTTLIGSPFFSLSEVSRKFGRKIGRNFLSQILKKYSFIQERIYQEVLVEIKRTIGKRKQCYVILDDTMIEKSGKVLPAVFKWYDHSKSRQIRGYCLVNLTLSIDGEVILFLPWILTTPYSPTKYKNRSTKQQDIKNIAALSLIETLIRWFDELAISKKRIVIEADSWFSFRVFRNKLDEIGLKYRIDSKSNYTVQQVDHEAIAKAKEQTRGRKRTRFVKYVRYEEYFGPIETWFSFVDPKSGERIFYKTAQVNLKSGGQAIVYAFQGESYSSPKYILVNVSRKARPCAKTIYRDYQYRWTIEVCHRELKQEFNIGKCQCQDQWTIKGFFFLVCLCYSLFKLECYKHLLRTGESIKCPSWARDFHVNQIRLLERG